MENGKKNKKRTRFYYAHITKVLNAIDEGFGITLDARSQLNGAVCHISTKLSEIAKKFAVSGKKKTVSPKQIQSAIKLFFTGEYFLKIIRDADKAVILYSGSEKSFLNRQSRSGILIPPSVTERFLRDFGSSSMYVSENAPIYLASIIETISKTLLEGCIQFAKKAKHKRITIRDLYLSLKNNQQIDGFFETNGIRFIRGGVVPYVNEEVMKRSKSKKVIMEVNRLQNNDDELPFCKIPFERGVRLLIPKGMKVSKDVFITLQYYIKRELINLLVSSNEIAVHCGRMKLKPDDMDLALRIR
jgi:histone H2B